MSAHHLSSREAIVPLHIAQVEGIISTLILLAEKNPGRVVFATKFTPEDQVIAHLIFRNNINIRVYTPGTDANYEILAQSVDFFQRGIEVLFHQSKAAFRRVNHEALVARVAPQHWPLAVLLDQPHVQVSGLRGTHLPEGAPNFEWYQTTQRSVYYPLLHWNNAQVAAYLHHYQIPQLPHPLSIEQAFTYFSPAL